MTERKTTIRHDYLPERRLVECGVRKVGVGVFLVDLETGRVCTVLEKTGKGSTGRKAGDISILLETRKEKESVLDNVVGAMEEVREMQAGEELVWIDGVSYKGRYSLVPNVLGDLCVIGLKNRQKEVRDFVCSEVSSGGWWKLEDLIEMSHLRTGVQPFIDLAIQHKWIEEFICRAHSVCESVRTYSKDEVCRYLQARQSMIDWAGSSQ